MANVSLDETALTTAERTIINTLRTIVTPTPQSFCCGVATVVEALTSVNAYEQVGFANFRHEFELVLDGTVDCTIESVEVTLSPIGPAPAITSANPFAVTFNKCSVTGDKLLSKIDVEFAADPSGESYDITNYNFLDADGATVTTFNPTTYDWDIP